MAMNLLRRLADGAPPSVFVALGVGAAERVDALFLVRGVVRVVSPRHANLLLVAGEPRADDLPSLRTVHDQMLPPRATLFWGATPLDGLASAATLEVGDDALPHLLRLHAQLRSGQHPGEPDLLPDEPPAPWRGVGDHGQGGKGMMGGTPYGRPMAMTGDDIRDGLALDEVTLQLGPYLHPWPAGLVLEWVLQGDVVQRARVVRAPLSPGDAALASPGADLRAAAGLLTLLELHAFAERCGRAASALDRGEPVDVAQLGGAVRRAGGWAAIPPDLGRCRVVGGGEVSEVDSDVRSRLQGWLSSASARSSSSSADGGLRDHADHPQQLVDLLTGLEWNEAMLVVNSFSAAQLHPIAPAEAPPQDDADADADADADGDGDGDGHDDADFDADAPSNAGASHDGATTAHPH